MTLISSYAWNAHYTDGEHLVFFADNAALALQMAIAYGLSLPGQPEVVVLERLGPARCKS
jgi:hypothetical protein